MIPVEQKVIPVLENLQLFSKSSDRQPLSSLSRSAILLFLLYLGRYFYPCNVSRQPKRTNKSKEFSCGSCGKDYDTKRAAHYVGGCCRRNLSKKYSLECRNKRVELKNKFDEESDQILAESEPVSILIENFDDEMTNKEKQREYDTKF